MTAPDQTATRVDPVKFEVIRNALSEATEEMAVALRHSAYSTNIKTRADFSCAFFDARMRPVAQSFSQPVHLGSMVNLVPISLQAYGPEKLGPGDAIVTNHPYVGGVHLNDVTVISPVHHEGKLMGYVASLAHHVDVGGGAPASVGAYREVYQEGIIIPPVRLLHSGEVVEDIFRLILSQIRSKHETAGDFRAQIAANNTGVRRLNALLDKQGSDTVVRYIDELIDYAERRTRHDLALLPRGVFEAEGIIDNDGFTDEPVRLVAKLTIDDDGVLFDLNGSDPQRRAPVNSTYAQTLAACAYVLKCLIDQDIPANDGFYRLVRIDAPLGTVVNCTDPSPVVGGWETQTRLIDVMLKALSGPLPERMPAGSKAMQCHAGFGGIAPDSGQYYCFLETLAGGYGGRAGLDGPDAVQCHGQNTENAPVEETERSYPVRILRYELVEDSDGPGEFRGGLGLRRDYSFDRHEATFSVLADRDREGPWGLFGGHAGRRAEYLLNPDGENPVKLGSKTTLDLSPGDVVSYRTCGGGGYGDPAKRDPQAVLIDVRDGKVSSARAREHYLVEIAADGRSIDEAATAALRAGHPGDTQNGGQA
jgi:N-methylhydantoinase B